MSKGYFEQVGNVPMFEGNGRTIAMGDGFLTTMFFDGTTPNSVFDQIKAMTQFDLSEVAGTIHEK